MDTVELDTMNLKQAFDRDGYIVVRGFLSPAETAAVNSQFDRYISQIVPTIPPTEAFFEVKGQPETIKQLMRLHQHDAYFRDFPLRDRFRNLACALLDDTTPVDNGVIWFNKPRRVGETTPPHQDGYYFRLEPNEALTLWLALDEVDEANGCMRYVPGSHLRGMRPHGKSGVLGFSLGITDYGTGDRAAELPIRAQPGELLVHHSMTIHRADANTSPRERRSLGLVFFSSRAKPDRAAIEAYQANLHKELVEKGKI
jgi:phytanoyl-CoA hydroxylase